MVVTIGSLFVLNLVLAIQFFFFEIVMQQKKDEVEADALMFAKALELGHEFVPDHNDSVVTKWCNKIALKERMCC